MTGLQNILDGQIATLEANARLAVLWAGSLLFVGVAVTATLYIIPATKGLQDLVKIGPGILAAALSSFQYWPVAAAKERRTLLRGLRAALSQTDAASASEQERIVDLAFEALKESGKR